MPSNRQGEIEGTNTVEERYLALRTEHQALGDPSLEHEIVSIGSSEPLFEEDKLPGTADQKRSAEQNKELEKIKKEHLIQTLQSLQYVSNAERPPKA